MDYEAEIAAEKARALDALDQIHAKLAQLQNDMGALTRLAQCVSLGLHHEVVQEDGKTDIKVVDGCVERLS